MLTAAEQSLQRGFWLLRRRVALCCGLWRGGKERGFPVPHLAVHCQTPVSCPECKVSGDCRFPQLKLWVAWCTATVYLEVFRWQLRAGSWPPLAACHSRRSEPSLLLSQGVFFSFSFPPLFFLFLLLSFPFSFLHGIFLSVRLPETVLLCSFPIPKQL